MKQCSLQSTPRLLLLTLMFWLAACGGSATVSAPSTPAPPVALDTPLAAPTQPARPTALAAAPSAAIALEPTTQAATAGLLISYHKSGGIAGINETLNVYADSTVELHAKSGITSAKADPSAVQALQKLLASPEFAALQVPTQPPAADQFVYVLTVPGRAQPIIATDGTGTPPLLREVIGALEQLKMQAK